MNTNNGAAHGLRPPPLRSTQERSLSANSQRSTSSMSTASNDSQSAAQLAAQRTVQSQQQHGAQRPSTAGAPGPPPAATASSINVSRYSHPRPPHDDPGKHRPHPISTGAILGHRPRQHSQGFFEPSLPTASVSGMSASAIAAAAAMSHLGPPAAPTHERKRSITSLSSINLGGQYRGASSPSNTSPTGAFGGNPEEMRVAATNAANAAFPKSPMSAGPTVAHVEGATLFPPTAPTVPEKETKTKEKTKMKLFSKPKSIGIVKDKDYDKKLPSLPSPAKRDLPNFSNMSTTSLAESTMSSSTSFYSSTNASTSTLTPVNSATPTTQEREKEKHRPHFLSRQKLKHAGERILPLSSASSNSQAVDPSAPQSLYSFTPQSPGANSSFSKSVTGFDLRHGGKGLRDRRKEEKAAASHELTSSSTLNLNADHRAEFLGPSSMGSANFGTPSGSNASVFSFDPNPSASAAAFTNLGNHMGLSGITPDDAWPLLKARLLIVFEGAEIRTPVEDFNLLVSVHIRRCVQKRAPHVLVEDVREFLHTGFISLAQTLRSIPDERLVPNLVEMWHMIYCRVLPFIQAVFLPLDLEFRGHGTIMTSREAQEFWGVMPEHVRTENGRQSLEATRSVTFEELDVRRMTLICFRDMVIMPRHDTLLNIFSRLSLDNINAPPSDSVTSRSRGGSNPIDRPGTAGGSLSPRLGSYSSQTSTLLDTGSSPSQSGFPSSRSRATSNTSAGSFGTSLPHLPSPMNPTSNGTGTPPAAAGVTSVMAQHSRTRSAISVPEPTAASILTATATAAGGAETSATSGRITETVARMLQCVSILAGVQTGADDPGQQVIEQLTGALKHNWLGRGRTGRQRKGFIGMRVGGMVGTPA